MAGWESHYDNNDFYANANYGGYWDTDHWVACGEDDTWLMENGTWSEGYRPSSFRLTFTGATTIGILVARKDSTVAYSSTAYSSASEVSITFSTSDLDYIKLSNPDAINVTNIEWYIPPIEVSLTEAAGAGDTIDFFSLSDAFTEAAGAGDSIAVQVLYQPAFAEAAGANDGALASRESEFVFSEAAGAGDSIDAFNWTSFLSQYEDLLVTRFYFTLTGDADSETDVEIPISSFNCRLRSGDPTYLQVVIPGDDYAAQVAARPNGQMVVEMDYLLSGVSQHREEIVRVDLEDIRTDEGSKKRSITLTGHRTVTYSGKIVDLRHGSYKSVTNGAMRVRCPEPDMYLRPGDTARYDGDSFVVNDISINVSISLRTMEVAEENG